VAANTFGVARAGDVLAALTQVFRDAEVTLAGAGITP
jgi:hypothetical protein